MNAACSISTVIDLMDTVGMRQFLSYQVGKHLVYVLVNPRTLLTLQCWENDGSVQGGFSQATEAQLLAVAYKKYITASGRIPEAQRKARDHFQEFTGGTDGTTQTGD